MEIAQRGSSPSQELLVLMQWMLPQFSLASLLRRQAPICSKTPCFVVFGSTECPSFFVMLFSGYAGRQGLSGEGADLALAVYTELLGSCVPSISPFKAPHTNWAPSEGSCTASLTCSAKVQEEDENMSLGWSVGHMTASVPLYCVSFHLHDWGSAQLRGWCKWCSC